MTVVVGFKLTSGAVLFASDTQHTAQLAWRLESDKIFTKTYVVDGAASMLAIAGDVHYAKMVIQHLEGRFAAIPPGGFSKGSVRDAIEEEVYDFHSHYAWKDPSQPQVQVMAAVSCPNEGVGFFSTQSASVNEMHGYHPMGCGDTIAHREMRKEYQAIRSHQPDNLASVLGIALRGIREVKGFVDGCGGATQVALLRADGTLKRVDRVQDDDSTWNDAASRLSAP